MNNWIDIVREQFLMIKSCGLNRFLINLSHSGDENNLSVIKEQADNFNIKLSVIHPCGGLDSYEKNAILFIEKLSKLDGEKFPFLYFHTKGVSCPNDKSRSRWRHVMQNTLITPWGNNLKYLENYDAVGTSYFKPKGQVTSYFAGNFWMANPSWIRKLPDFESFYTSRFSCEDWIGSSVGIRPFSILRPNKVFW